MKTNRLIAKIYYILSICYFLRKISNKLEILQNIPSLIRGKTILTIFLAKKWRFRVRDLYDLLALKEVFDDEIYKFIFEDISENTSLVDLGAYIGDVEIYAQQFHKVKYIIAVEPMPENFNLLKENISLNKIKNTLLLQIAVARQQGVLNLFINLNKGQSGFWKKSGKVEEIKVKTITLSEVIDKVKTKHIILKCDCEGAEYEIFMNTPLRILTKFQKMVFEYHSDKKLPKIISQLKRAGFYTTFKKHPVEPNLGTAYAEKY